MGLSLCIMLVSIVMLARLFAKSFATSIGMIMIGWITVCAFFLGASSMALFWLWVLR